MPRTPARAPGPWRRSRRSPPAGGRARSRGSRARARDRAGSRRRAPAPTAARLPSAGTAGRSWCPTNERNTCVARTNGFDAPPSRSYSLSWMETAMPLWCSTSANPASSGTWSVPSSRTRSPRTDPLGKLLTAADPDGLADTGHSPVPLHRADVDHRRPAESAHRRIRAQGAGHRDPLRAERGQERPGEAGILDPGPSQREAEDADHGEHPHGTCPSLAVRGGAPRRLRARATPGPRARDAPGRRGRTEARAPRAMPPPRRRCRPRTPSMREPTAGERSRRRRPAQNAAAAAGNAHVFTR